MSRTPRDSQPISQLLNLIEEKHNLTAQANAVDAQIGQTVRSFRKANSLTQTELAAGISRSQAYVAQVENSTRAPSDSFVTAFLTFAQDFSPTTDDLRDGPINLTPEEGQRFREIVNKGDTDGDNTPQDEEVPNHE